MEVTKRERAVFRLHRRDRVNGMGTTKSPLRNFGQADVLNMARPETRRQNEFNGLREEMTHLTNSAMAPTVFYHYI